MSSPIVQSPLANLNDPHIAYNTENPSTPVNLPTSLVQDLQGKVVEESLSDPELDSSGTLPPTTLGLQTAEDSQISSPHVTSSTPNTQDPFIVQRKAVEGTRRSFTPVNVYSLSALTPTGTQHDVSFEDCHETPCPVQYTPQVDSLRLPLGQTDHYNQAEVQGGRGIVKNKGSSFIEDSTIDRAPSRHKLVLSPADFQDESRTHDPVTNSIGEESFDLDESGIDDRYLNPIGQDTSDLLNNSTLRSDQQFEDDQTWELQSDHGDDDESREFDFGSDLTETEITPRHHPDDDYRSIAHLFVSSPGRLLKTDSEGKCYWPKALSTRGRPGTWEVFEKWQERSCPKDHKWVRLLDNCCNNCATRAKVMWVPDFRSHYLGFVGCQIIVPRSFDVYKDTPPLQYGGCGQCRASGTGTGCSLHQRNYGTTLHPVASKPKVSSLMGLMSTPKAKIRHQQQSRPRRKVATGIRASSPRVIRTSSGQSRGTHPSAPSSRTISLRSASFSSSEYSAFAPDTPSFDDATYMESMEITPRTDRTLATSQVSGNHRRSGDTQSAFSKTSKTDNKLEHEHMHQDNQSAAQQLLSQMVTEMITAYEQDRSTATFRACRAMLRWLRYGANSTAGVDENLIGWLKLCVEHGLKGNGNGLGKRLNAWRTK